MNVPNAHMRSVRLQAHAGVAIARAVVVLSTVASLAAATLIVSAASEPVRVIGVSAQGTAVVIETTDPVAYTVSRPDATTLVVDLRGATVGDGSAKVQPQGAISGVRLEQATSPDGLAVARVRIALARASEYTVKSARNTIRLELASPNAAPVAKSTTPTMPAMPCRLRRPRRPLPPNCRPPQSNRFAPAERGPVPSSRFPATAS
jgi:AMIN domain-containing protein